MRLRARCPARGWAQLRWAAKGAARPCGERAGFFMALRALETRFGEGALGLGGARET